MKKRNIKNNEKELKKNEKINILNSKEKEDEQIKNQNENQIVLGKREKMPRLCKSKSASKTQSLSKSLNLQYRDIKENSNS